MDKENYLHTELEIIHFHTDDVIATSSSDLIEESNSQSGGGKLIDP